MGTLVFQATLGGAVNIIGPNIASTINFTLPSADGTSGQTWTTNGSGLLTFGTLGVAGGGTGLTTLATGSLSYGAGTSAFSALAIGTAGQILTVNSGATAPQWSTLTGVAVTTFSAGTTGFTPSSATAGAITLSGTLVAANGGTGQSSYAVGDLLYASTTTALSKLADVATGNALISGGVGVAPSWGKIGLTTHVSGTLPTANGGTNLTSFTSGGVVYASSSSALATGSALTFDGTSLDLGTVGAKVNFATTGSATRNYVGGSADGYSLEMVTQRGASQPLTYKQDYSVGHAWSIAGSGAMTLTSTGLGIGTSSPSAKLDVNQAATSFPGFRISGNSSPGMQIAETSGSVTAHFVNDSAGCYFGTTTSHPLIFRTNNTERARIDSSGNLLVGTTSQFSNAKLTVSSTATDGIASTQGTAGGYCFVANALSNGGTYYLEAFSANGSSVGSITSNGTTTSYNITSDQRLKENIQDSDSASNLIDSLQVRKFDWKADSSHQRYGFIAQELVTIAPEAVHQPADTDEMMAVDYSKLVPMLVKEIQSLRQRLSAANL